MSSIIVNQGGSRTLFEARRRRIALAILSLFYSIKGYIWSNYSTVNLRYELIVAGFISLNVVWALGVNLFRVPRLDSWFVLCLVFVAMSLTDLSLTQSIVSRSSGFVICSYCNRSLTVHIFQARYFQEVPDKQLATLDSSIKISGSLNDWEDLLGTSHIMGSLDVNVLPPIHISFLEETALCLGGSRKYVNLCFKSNSPPPLKAELLFYGFDGITEKNTISFEGTEAKSQEYDDILRQNMYFYSIRAEKVGVYKIISASNNSDEKSVINRPGNMLNVPSCPEGSISVLDKPKKDKDSDRFHKCVGSKLTFNVELSGVPPFEIKCLKIVGSSRQIIPMSAGSIHGPLSMDYEHLYCREDGCVDDNVGKLLSAYTRTKVVLPIEMPIDEPTEYYFQLLRVTDATENTVVYNTERDIQGLEMSAEPPNFLRIDKIGDDISLDVSLLPTASFPELGNLRLRSDGSGEHETIPVNLTGSPPWRIEYSVASSESKALEGEYIFTDVLENIFTPRANIIANIPGVYILTGVSDYYCEGALNINRMLAVTLNLPPTLDIKMNQLVEQCLGPRGVIFDLKFTGEPPFTLEYEEKHIETLRSTLKTHIVRKHHEVLTLEPKIAGTYEYNFLKLADSVFTKSTALKNVTFQQVIKVYVSASLVPKKVTICPGGRATIPVDISGQDQCDIEYSVSKGSRLTKHTASIKGLHAEIVLESLKDPGLYTVDLISVTDGNGCKGHIVGDPATVEVASSLPKASIRGGHDEFIVTGSTKDIFIQTNGGGVFDIEVLHEETNTVISVTGTDILKFSVSQPGTYSLKSVNNSYCKGIPVPPNSVKVVPVKPPTMSLMLNEDTKEVDPGSGIYVTSGVCAGTPRKVGFELSGQFPFYLRYSQSTVAHNIKVEDVVVDGLSEEHIDALENLFDSGSSAQLNYVYPLNEVESQHGTVYVTLNTTHSGEHVHYFYAPGDSNYPNISKNATMDTKPALILKHQVFSMPRAAFLDKKKKAYQCIFNESKTSILIGLNGIPPFSFIVGVQRDNGPITYESLTSDSYIYEYQPKIPDTIGTYKYSLHFIKDSTGCESAINQSNIGSVVYRQIIGIASIAPAISATEVCRGDVIPFTLEGIPPFTISYSMDGKEMPTIIVTEPLLTICPIKKGILKINKVCNSLGCCSEPKPDINIVVHELPTIKIGDGSNEYIEMREGRTAEIVYELTGEPPFSFRYIVTPLSDAVPHRKDVPSQEAAVKSILVTGVKEHNIKLSVSTRGRYSVVMVKDAHCQYPPVLKSSLCRESNNIANA